jgi:hypothetical protein
MAILGPGPTRAVVEHNGTTIRVRIPTAKYAWVLALLCVGLLGFWVIAFSQAWGQFLEREKLELAFLVIFWAYGTVVLAYHAVWLLGAETIEVTPASLRYRRSIATIGWWKEYALADARRLRVPECEPSGADFEIGLKPRIFFDYGAKTVKVGSGVDLAEAHQLVAEITRHYPQLSKESS